MSQGGRYRPNAMIDLSDGLARDLGHLCHRSRLCAQVRLNQLPIHEDVRAFHPEEEPWRHALGDGEDYELCFTVGPEAAGSLPSQIDGVALSCIGEMVSRESEPQVKLIMPDGSFQSADHLGWEHGT